MKIFSEISSLILPLIIVFIVVYGMIKRTNVYASFVDGAKEGFKVSFDIIGYLLAIIVVISMLRASTFLDFVSLKVKVLFDYVGVPVDIFPMMIVRSLSGSALLGMLNDIVGEFGANSFVAKLGAIMVGSSETTLYVISVYFGSVGIKRIRYALAVGLLADVIGIIVSIVVAYIFFK